MLVGPADDNLDGSADGMLLISSSHIALRQPIGLLLHHQTICNHRHPIYEQPLGSSTYQPGTDHLPVQCWLLLCSAGGMVPGSCAAMLLA